MHDSESNIRGIAVAIGLFVALFCCTQKSCAAELAPRAQTRQSHCCRILVFAYCWTMLQQWEMDDGGWHHVE